MIFSLLLPTLLLGGAWAGSVLLLSLWLTMVRRWPGQRRSALWVAVLPWLVGGVLLLAALCSGDPHRGEILWCHCETSMPTWLHLCPVHPDQAGVLLVPTVLLLGLLLPGRIGALWPLLRLPRGIGHATMPILADLPQPTAVLMGWWRPSLVVDQALWRALSRPEQAALLAHEAGHLARRDPQMLMVLQVLLSAAPRGLARRVVQSWLDWAEEQADSAAAHTVGDPLLVAAALLRCARLQRPEGTGGLAWTGGSLERRIERLLLATAPSWTAARPDIGLQDALWLGVLVVPVVFTVPWLHHQIEHLLNLSLPL